MRKKIESIHCSRHSEAGLSLIEVSIIVILFSIVLIPILHVLSLENKSAESRKHYGVPNDFANLLTDYALEHGAYPVPAAPRLALSDPKVFMPVDATTAEVPTAACATVGGTAVEGKTNGVDNGVLCRPRFNGDGTGNAPTGVSLVDRQVYIGTLPVSVLGLSPSQGLDEYGRKYTYIVNRILTNKSTFDNAKGSIIISDKASNWQSYSVHFVIISHGKDGAGGWAANGSLMGVNNINGCKDGRNVGGTWTYTDQERGNQYQCKKYAGLYGYARALFLPGPTYGATQDPSVYEGDPSDASFFDDAVAFRDTVYSNRLWTPRDDGANKNEYFSAKGSVGIGYSNGTTAYPAQKLTVATGNIRTVQAQATDPKTVVKSAAICTASSSYCFTPSDIATTAGSTAPLYCASNVGLQSITYPGTKVATKTCYSVPILNPALATCPLGIKGFQTNGAPICAQ